jgi:hypothetical protein
MTFRPVACPQRKLVGFSRRVVVVDCGSVNVCNINQDCYISGVGIGYGVLM